MNIILNSDKQKFYRKQSTLLPYFTKFMHYHIQLFFDNKLKYETVCETLQVSIIISQNIFISHYIMNE